VTTGEQQREDELEGFPQPAPLRNIGSVTVAETRQDLGNGVHSIVYVRTWAVQRFLFVGMVISPHIPWIVSEFQRML